MERKFKIKRTGEITDVLGVRDLRSNEYTEVTSNNMNIRKVEQAKTAEEARQYAIDWQKWASEKNLSYGELNDWQDVFGYLATKYPELKEEFEENSII